MNGGSARGSLPLRSLASTFPFASTLIGVYMSPIPTSNPSTNGTGGGHYHLFTNEYLDLTHTGDTMALVFTIFVIGLVKAVVTFVHSIPHSVVLLLAGGGAGVLIQKFWPNEVTLNPHWFFLYLLPVIVFEAGFCMKNKDFFLNLGTICVYAVAGTILNIALLTGFLYLVQGWFTYGITYTSLLLFATIICAVDPVAVLTVFDDIGVNELLYICVFGESLLNDAVTIVLYQSLKVLSGSDTVYPGDELGTTSAKPEGSTVMLVLGVILQFFKVSTGGILFGIIAGYFTSWLTKILVNQQHVQPVVILLFPYLTYLLADSFHFSGILALIVCGIIMKNYMQPNINEDMMRFTEVMLKFLCSYSEAFIFVFLGISLYSSGHIFDYPLIFFTLIGITIARFIGVYFLTYFLNMTRDEHEKIGIHDQFIMGYGGLRGAVCYGLVSSLDEKTMSADEKNVLVTTTIVIVAATTILQGSSIKYMVNFLKVKLSKKKAEEEEQNFKVFHIVQRQMMRHVANFVEDLCDSRKQNFVFRKFMEVDEEYLKPHLIADYALHCYIGDQHKIIEMDEYAKSIRCGSFAGLPHVPSSARIPQSASTSAIVDTAAEPTNTLQVPKLQMPRNESISNFVKQSFEISEGKGIERNRRSRYSRHFVAPSPSPFADSPSDSEYLSDGDYIFTYPGPRSDKNLATDIKAFVAMQRASQKKKGPSPNRRRPSSIAERASERRSVERPTAAPVRLSNRFTSFKHTIEDETADPSPPNAPRGPKPPEITVRKLSSGTKNFTVGPDEAHELLPIEEHDESHLDTSR